MDLKRFQYFLQVADLGSLSRAAEVLGIAQPALSRQMRLLEEQLEITLFTRNSRGMALTDAGEELRARILGPLRQLKLALQDVRLHSPSMNTAIALGLPATVASIVAVPLLQCLREKGAAVQLKIVEASPALLHSKLIAGELDMALLHDPPPDERILMRDVLSEKLHLIGSRESMTSQTETIDFRTLSELPLILPGEGNCLRDTAEKYAALTKSLLNVTVELDSLQATKDLIEAGVGYGILPSHLIARETAAGSLCAALIVNPAVTRRFKVASRSECKKPRSIVQVAQAFSEVIGHLAATGAWAIQLFD